MSPTWNVAEAFDEKGDHVVHGRELCKVDAASIHELYERPDQRGSRDRLPMTHAHQDTHDVEIAHVAVEENDSDLFQRLCAYQRPPSDRRNW